MVRLGSSVPTEAHDSSASSRAPVVSSLTATPPYAYPFPSEYVLGPLFWQYLFPLPSLAFSFSCRKTFVLSFPELSQHLKTSRSSFRFSLSRAVHPERS